MAKKKSGAAGKGPGKKAAAREPSNAQLADLQKRLNSNTRLRNQFFKDPGSVLRRDGIELGEAKEKQLADYTRKMTAVSPPMEVFGAEVMKVTEAGVRIRTIIRLGLIIEL